MAVCVVTGREIDRTTARAKKRVDAWVERVLEATRESPSPTERRGARVERGSPTLGPEIGWDVRSPQWNDFEQS